MATHQGTDFANKSSRETTTELEYLEYFTPYVPASWKSIAIASFVGYVALCYLLRFRRIKYMRSHYNFTDRASLSRMSNQDAYELLKMTITHEFPMFYELSLRVALFRTYAMENIAKLLGASSDLAKARNAGKRYEDTAVLYTCFSTFAPTSDTFHKAVARTNFLHAPYIKSGRITNDDLLYVLYAGMVEPIRFMRLFEWRPLDDIEVAALGTFWKYVGEGMQIDYKSALGKDRWTDGIDFIDDVTQWSLKYEDKYMRPREEVYLLGQILIDMHLDAYPSFTRPIVRKVLIVLLGDQMRHAFGLPEPSITATALTYSSLLARQLFLRYLSLPRFFPVSAISDPDTKTGRIKHYRYLKEPYYNPATISTRWSLEALLTWVTGGAIPGDGGAEMKPEGFLFQDLGPHRTMGQGVKDAPLMEDMVKQRVSAGCPFAVSK